jgi:hypothetical protein
MKKIILSTFLISMLFSFPVFSQNTHFGIRAGAGLANIGGSNLDAKEAFRTIIGYHGGLYANVAIDEKFSIEPGARYAVRGTSFEFALNTDDIRRNSYLDIPVLVRYRANEIFDVFAGPQASFFLNSVQTIKIFDNKEVNKGGDLNDVWNKFDMGAVIGFAAYLPAGLHIQFSYELGMINVFQDAVSGEKGYNRGFNVSVGKSFGK